ncbi:MAG: hypothetical protein ACLQRH_07900 [Acidimicrobiales bacterium]
MSYVDAGYAVALVSLFLYGMGLVLRRRRWERAVKASDGDESVGPGARS